MLQQSFPVQPRGQVVPLGSEQIFYEADVLSVCKCWGLTEWSWDQMRAGKCTERVEKVCNNNDYVKTK